MTVNGETATDGGAVTWYEEFSWEGPSPHPASFVPGRA